MKEQLRLKFEEKKRELDALNEQLLENKAYQLDILERNKEDLAALKSRGGKKEHKEKDGEQEPDVTALLHQVGAHIKRCYSIIGEVQEGKEIMEILEDIEIVIGEIRKVIQVTYFAPENSKIDVQVGAYKAAELEAIKTKVLNEERNRKAENALEIKESNLQKQIDEAKKKADKLATR